jgi:hypothetical protein
MIQIPRFSWYFSFLLFRNLRRDALLLLDLPLDGVDSVGEPDLEPMSRWTIIALRDETMNRVGYLFDSDGYCEDLPLQSLDLC